MPKGHKPTRPAAKSKRGKATPKGKAKSTSTARTIADPETRRLLNKKEYNFDSKQALSLVKRWAWGKISAAELQRSAQEALDDQMEVLKGVGATRDFAQKSLRDLAKLGTNGKHTSNIKKELLNLLGEPDTAAAVAYDVPTKVLKPNGEDAEEERDIPTPIFEPHRQVASLYEHSRKRFNTMFLGGRNDGSKLQEFWDGVEKSGDPRLEGHPMRDRADWKTKAIPVMLHGDPVPVTGVGKAGTKSFDVSSLQGVLSMGSTLAVKLYMSGVFTSNKTGDGRTDEMIWKVLVWSLWFMYLAVWPTISFDRSSVPPRAGEALCGLFFFRPVDCQM